VLTLIQNGDVYSPTHLGVQSVLLAGERIIRMGDVDADAVRRLDDACEVVDASGCAVVPGFVDPHEHLIGAGGEQGFGSRMPEVMVEDLLRAGITTAVGCLGTDTTTRRPAALLGKARELCAKGITAYIYIGGFPVPPATITGSVTDDLIIVDEVIGIGEVAIADYRSSEPSLADLAQLVSGGIVGGLVGGKAGVTHFHVGEGRARLGLLRSLIEQHEIPARYCYPTHINRSAALMDEAIALAGLGAYVDTDVIDENLDEWLPYYREHGGDPNRLTVSSDAQTIGGEPRKLYEACVRAVRGGTPIEEALPHFTRNAAEALRLDRKGCLRPGADADLLLMDRGTLDLVHVFARGAHLLRNGNIELLEAA
jgi:beta-aspartyl-dipeptidase (metallo-type)